MRDFILIVAGCACGIGAMLNEARRHSRRADASDARAKRAYEHGLAMGLSVRPTYVRDGKLEHWNADAETCLRSLIAPSTFAPSANQLENE